MSGMARQFQNGGKVDIDVGEFGDIVKQNRDGGLARHLPEVVLQSHGRHFAAVVAGGDNQGCVGTQIGTVFGEADGFPGGLAAGPYHHNHVIWCRCHDCFYGVSFFNLGKIGVFPIGTKHKDASDTGLRQPGNIAGKFCMGNVSLFIKDW